MNNEGKLTFLKKIKFSVFNFEKYQELATEKVIKTIIYIAILILVFTLTITGIYTYRFMKVITNIRQYIDENIETITFENNQLNVIPKNHEEMIIIENQLVGFKVIINTQIEDKEKIDEMISQENRILILKDKVLIRNEMINTPYMYSYDKLVEQYNINKIDKQETLNLLSYDTIKPLIFSVFGILLIYFFIIIYLPSTLVDIIMLSLFCYIVSNITRMRLKYSAVYNIAAYSITLPILLNLLYFVVNSFTGFTIKYFDIMYITVATIYIIAAILMIRDDTIKKQIQLTRIIEEQDKVRAELQRREEEKKQEEKERQEREDKEKRKQEKKEEKGSLGKEPEGNNV